MVASLQAPGKGEVDWCRGVIRRGGKGLGEGGVVWLMIVGSRLVGNR
jgi:hypothetical protein